MLSAEFVAHLAELARVMTIFAISLWSKFEAEP